MLPRILNSNTLVTCSRRRCLSLSPWQTCRQTPEATNHHGNAVAATLRMFGDAHNLSPTRSVTLPARSQARSDEPEASKQPLVVPEIHPFTGTFAASEHTVAFGSKAFRSAFPLHVVALACRFGLSVATFVTSVTFGSTIFQRATDMLFLGLPPLRFRPAL